MAIAYFNSASTPADNNPQAGPGPVAVTPPASMVAGDLVVLLGQQKGSEDITVSESGGQTWNAIDHFAAISGVSNRARMFWCRYNGTWSANPSLVVASDVDAFTVIMHVFRPTAGANTWAVDVAQATTSGSAPADPYTVTITGITTLTDGAVVLASWSTGDDNSWGTLTAGWTSAGSSQYRNTTGVDQSITTAYLVKASAGGTGNVSMNQTVVVGDAYATAIIAFKEIAAGGGGVPVFMHHYLHSMGRE